MFETIKTQTLAVVKELLTNAKLQAGDLVVVGCSSSEITGERIGSHSSEELGTLVFQTIYSELSKHQIHLAAQCCEHLNRALILETDTAQLFGYELVNVVPQLKAGGSFATAAYKTFNQPAAVEEIKAKAGIDIGDTIIGMHLAKVAVPIRISTKQIGYANVVCARTRLKYIGGERAHYNKEL